MAGNTVTLAFAGDSRDLERTFTRVGSGALEMAHDLDKAEGQAKTFGKAMDRAGDATGASEGKFMGAADLLDGLGGAFGLPTEGATNMMRSFGDLSGGASTLAPALGKVGTAMKTMMGPIGLAVLAVAAIGTALVQAYKHSETFRDIVQGAFKAVWTVIGPIVNTIKSVVGGLFGLFSSGSKESAEDLEEMAERNKVAMQKAQADFDATKTKFDSWVEGIASGMESLLDPTQRFEENTENTLDRLQGNLAKNIAAWTNWTTNIKTLADRGYKDLAANFVKMGPEWAVAAEEAATATDKRLREMNRLFTVAGDRSGTEWALGFSSAIGRNAPVPAWLQPGSTTGKMLSGGLMGGGALTTAGGGGITVNMNVAGSIQTERQITDAVVAAIKRGQQTGYIPVGSFGGI